LTPAADIRAAGKKSDVTNKSISPLPPHPTAAAPTTVH